MTTGVMIALALVPSMAIVGMAIRAGDFSAISGGLSRWAVDAVLVIVAAAVAFIAKRALLHRRSSLG
jgi:uncharacterized membrane protein